MSVQRYSVQYKGYNLVGVITVEGGASRGTTALVFDSYIAAYIQVLYRVTGVHPTGPAVDQGCRQVSTILYFSATAPYFYGSILLQALKSKIIVPLTHVCKK